MIALFIATIAVALAVGGWLGVRYAEATTETDLTRFVVSIPPHEWSSDD